MLAGSWPEQRLLIVAVNAETGERRGVPLIENPPLAQALYKSVDVGQEIPSHLFRAVAGVLAYVYKDHGKASLRGICAKPPFRVRNIAHFPFSALGSERAALRIQTETLSVQISWLPGMDSNHILDRFWIFRNLLISQSH